VTPAGAPLPSPESGMPGTPASRRLAPGSVAAVIVTWRRREAIGVLLAALARQSRPVDFLIVVDNSPDQSVADLVAAYPGPATHVPSWRNLGSAGGFALGALTALACGASWVWFLDDDGRPATDGCLGELLACAARFGLALVVPVVVNVDEPGRLSFLMRRGLKWAGRLEELPEREFLPGHACLFNGALFSAGTLDVIGVPDYRLFLRGDEVEFHRRARRSGLSFGTCLTTSFLHPSGTEEFKSILGGLVWVQDPLDPGKRYYTFRNRGFLSTQPGRRLRWPIEWACFAWHFLVARRDAAGFREWLRLTRMGRRERLLRRAGQ
jgi:rhamnopyranosyl-N-acetylglucosaminyl-diphospho-decaprenol beta-1,3/1,4-galactofuranosyltransferase